MKVNRATKKLQPRRCQALFLEMHICRCATSMLWLCYFFFVWCAPLSDIRSADAIIYTNGIYCFFPFMRTIIPAALYICIDFILVPSRAAAAFLPICLGRKFILLYESINLCLPKSGPQHQFPKIKDSQPVSFLVASVIPSRPNIVAKAEITKAVFDAFSSRPRGGINKISSTFLNVINVPTDSVAIEGSGEGHLYVMHSPKFVPSHIKPMHSVAIGSGQKMQEQVLQIADQLHFDTHGEYPDVTWFRRSLDHYLRVSGEPTVGGMFTIMKITGRHGMQSYSHTRIDITNKEAYELTIQGTENRWVQRKMTTGEVIELLLPWEVDDKEVEDHRFDGLRPKSVPKTS